MTLDLLKYKRILIVDDEADVLDSLEELLEMCDVERASDFTTAKKMLEGQHFDIAILDIMGVDGYQLLEIANRRDVIALMLTANAFTPEDTLKSFDAGAAYYVPKEKMDEITTYLNDILELKLQGKPFLERWLERFSHLYDKRFGNRWRRGGFEHW